MRRVEQYKLEETNWTIADETILIIIGGIACLVAVSGKKKLA